MLVDHIVPGNIVHLTDVVEPEMVTPAPVITLVTSVEALSLCWYEDIFPKKNKRS